MISSQKLLSVSFALAVSLGVSGAHAQTAGETEYMNSCATCHGIDGTGNGPLAGFLTVSVPDLTTISARNDDRFPFLDIMGVIDGRISIRAHGGPMPVWGLQFLVEANVDEPGYMDELLTRGRIYALTEHLESLQQ